MKRIYVLSTCVMISIFFLSSCAEVQPYQQYRQSYQKLLKEDSFIVEKKETLITSQKSFGTSKNISNINNMEGTFRYVRNKEEDMLIANVAFNTMDGTPTILNYYNRGGYLYSQNITNPAKNFRSQQKADNVINTVLEGIIDIPKDVIAKQSVRSTSEGNWITFELDSEKYYAARFPETYAEYGYGGLSYYREQPVYTVLLDAQDRIKQVEGSFCTVNSDNSGFTWDQNYTNTFTQYEDVKLDFPDLHESEFPLLKEPDESWGQTP
ncbi:hypothetical protein [Dehalobacterium formicoaceticum]|uniref:Lipoprotein n=1 Tax=Dehalobacterium formicoaceticum TaxID=51515 RepID=A0ABT1XZT4_9FIRM|nr:hypothetical protein [Dehalobacterium formicoaceticum]MCR6544127.1 hypothetical protein [Dehalobacterium formicoaceticum]